ncbi:DUF6893 family small protein [Mycolicibacterium poriferae]
MKRTIKPAVLTAGIAAAAYLGWREYPALKRYLKLSRM